LYQEAGRWAKRAGVRRKFGAVPLDRPGADSTGEERVQGNPRGPGVRGGGGAAPQIMQHSQPRPATSSSRELMAAYVSSVQTIR